MPNQKNDNQLRKNEIKNSTSADLASKATKKNSNDSKSTSLQPTKWILFLLLIAGIGLLSESLYEKFVPSVTQIEMHSQSHFVSRDIYDMYKKGEIPKYFFQLKNIKWSYYDDELKKQIPMESIPFKTTINGAYNLEIDAFSSSKKTSKIAVLQMNLIEIKSGNKVWELSRNYEIPTEK